MHSGTPELDGDDGVKLPDGGLEGREVVVLVWEDTEVTGFDSKTNTSGDVLLRRLEPSVALRLFEDMVKDSVVRVVIHCVRLGE